MPCESIQCNSDKLTPVLLSDFLINDTHPRGGIPTWFLLSNNQAAVVDKAYYEHSTGQGTLERKENASKSLASKSKNEKKTKSKNEQNEHVV